MNQVLKFITKLQGDYQLCYENYYNELQENKQLCLELCYSKLFYYESDSDFNFLIMDQVLIFTLLQNITRN